MKEIASHDVINDTTRDLPFRLGVLIDPARLAKAFTSVRNAPSLRRHAIYMTATDRELRALESSLVPRAAQLEVHTEAGAAAVIALTIQSGGTQYRLLLPVLSPEPIAWLDEASTAAGCLIAVDVTDRQQLALVSAAVTPARRAAKRQLVAIPEMTVDVLVATARSMVDLTTQRTPSLLSGFSVERVEVVVVSPSQRVPLAAATSATVH